MVKENYVVKDAPQLETQSESNGYIQVWTPGTTVQKVEMVNSDQVLKVKVMTVVCLRIYVALWAFWAVTP